MNKVITLLAATLISLSSFAQPEGHQGHERHKNKGEVKAMRVAFITTQMELTPEESEKFWPLVNQFDAKRKEIKKPFKQKEKAMIEKGIENASDDEIKAILNERFDNHASMIALEKEFVKKYLAVLPAQKVAKYYHSEERFKKHLLKKMREERGEKRSQGKGPR